MLLKETLWAYPELLFSRVVVLCEGDSERLVLPKLFAAHANPQVQTSSKISIPFEIDDSFVSVVPLDGRHTDHYWRLLHELRIPFVTLLDLDLGRADAGMGRVRAAYEKINYFHHRGDAKTTAINRMAEIDTLSADAQDPRATIPGSSVSWLDELEGLDVFYSGPLDLDLMMLEAFPAEYQALEDNEQGPSPVTTTDDRVNLYKAVLGSDRSRADTPAVHTARAAVYTEAQRALFPWYRYRFLSKQKGKGKPIAHLKALGQISPECLWGGCPGVLERLVVKVQSLAAALTE